MSWLRTNLLRASVLGITAGCILSACENNLHAPPEDLTAVPEVCGPDRILDGNTVHSIQTPGDCMSVLSIGDSSQAKVLLLFAHGDGASRDFVKRICEELAETTTEHSVFVACPYRSNTNTPNSAQERGRTDDVNRQVAVLNWLATQCERCETILAGHSRGGQLVTGAAQMLDRPVSCLFASAPALDYAARNRRKNQRPSRPFYDAAQYTDRMTNVEQMFVFADPRNDKVVPPDDYLGFVSNAQANGVPVKVLRASGGHRIQPKIPRSLARRCFG